MPHIDFNDAADTVACWNRRAGNEVSRPQFKDVVSQSKVSLEEVKELFVAIEKTDMIRNGEILPEELGDYDPVEETLDGAVDAIVTVLHLITLLENRGFDVSEAFYRAMDNNELKIYNSFDEAFEVATRLNDINDENGGDETFYVDEYCDLTGQWWFTVKDGNGKIRKRPDHPKLFIKDLCPEMPFAV